MPIPNNNLFNFAAKFLELGDYESGDSQAGVILDIKYLSL